MEIHQISGCKQPILLVSLFIRFCILINVSGFRFSLIRLFRCFGGGIITPFCINYFLRMIRYKKTIIYLTCINERGWREINFKGVVRSKVSHGYVKVDGLGETMLFIRTKFEKKIGRYMGRPIQLAQNIFVRLWLTWQAQQTLATITEQSTNQISQRATCRPIGSRCLARGNMSERC